MRAGGNFWNDTAVTFENIDLGNDNIREQVWRVNRNSSRVASSFSFDGVISLFFCIRKRFAGNNSSGGLITGTLNG